MEQVVQVFGALLILAAFVMVQAKKMDPTARSYLVLNALGSAILAYDAFHTQQWGFVLLEGVWAIVSIKGLLDTFKKHTV